MTNFSRLFCCLNLILIALLWASAPVSAQLKTDTREVEFEGYKISIPSRFEPVEVPSGSLPTQLKLAPYQATLKGDVTEALMFTTNKIPQAVDEAKKDIAKVSAGFLAGLMRSKQVKVGKPDNVKEIDWQSFKVTKISYSISLSGGEKSLAQTYSFLDGEKMVCFVHVVYAGDANAMCESVDAAFLRGKDKKVK